MSWPNLGDLLTDDPTAPVGLVGAPLETGSVTPGRCDLAPARLRATLRRIGRYNVESERELGAMITDHGDVPVTGLSIEEATPAIATACNASVAQHALSLLIGGNNAVTRPGLHGMAEALGLPLEKVGLITLDAHFDMRDTNDGLSNGNPVRALIEDGLPGRNIVQLGIAPFANSRQMHEDATAAGNHIFTLSMIEMVSPDWLLEQIMPKVVHCEAIMVDCDIDLIDRTQFPAAPGARPLGLSAESYLRLARTMAAQPRVRLIDLTEWDPPLDPTDLSALTAARWLAEVLTGFEARAR